MSIKCESSIAVLLATYNGETYLKEQLQSLLGQTMQDFCIYAHDDGSSDTTPQVLTKWAQQHPDKLVILDGKATGSAKSNYLYLLEQVSAPYYMFCDQDDIWHADKIEKTWSCLRALEKDPEVPLLVHTNLQVVDSSANVIASKMSDYQKTKNRYSDFSHLLVQNTVTGCTAMINDSLKKLAIRCCETSDMVMHDWWLALIAARFGTIGYVDEALISYRQHGGNVVGAMPYGNPRFILKRLLAAKEIIRSLQRTRAQAKLFADVFAEDEESLAFRYSRIGSLGKIGRLRFYFSNGVVKQGLIRVVGQIVFG